MVLNYKCAFNNPSSYRKQYEDAYARFKPDKRLHWIPQIGNVSITLDLEDRTLNLDVTPFQATVIDLFAVNGRCIQISWHYVNTSYRRKDDSAGY